MLLAFSARRRSCCVRVFSRFSLRACSSNERRTACPVFFAVLRASLWKVLNSSVCAASAFIKSFRRLRLPISSSAMRLWRDRSASRSSRGWRARRDRRRESEIVASSSTRVRSQCATTSERRFRCAASIAGRLRSMTIGTRSGAGMSSGTSDHDARCSCIAPSVSSCRRASAARSSSASRTDDIQEAREGKPRSPRDFFFCNSRSFYLRCGSFPTRGFTQRLRHRSTASPLQNRRKKAKILGINTGNLCLVWISAAPGLPPPDEITPSLTMDMAMAWA